MISYKNHTSWIKFSWDFILFVCHGYNKTKKDSDVYNCLQSRLAINKNVLKYGLKNVSFDCGVKRNEFILNCSESSWISLTVKLLIKLIFELDIGNNRECISGQLVYTSLSIFDQVIPSDILGVKMIP